MFLNGASCGTGGHFFDLLLQFECYVGRRLLTASSYGTEPATPHLGPVSAEVSPIIHPLQNVVGLEVKQGLLDTVLHDLLTLTDPDSGVVLLLVGLVITLGVADLGPIRALEAVV